MISSSFSSPCSHSGSYFPVQSNPAGRGNPARLTAPVLAGLDQCFHSSLPRLAPSLSSPVATHALAVMWSCLPCFAGVSPAHGFWALSKKLCWLWRARFAILAMVRGEMMGDVTAPVPCVTCFRLSLRRNFPRFHTSLSCVVWVPVRVGSLCVPHMSHSWLGHGFQKHTSDQT